MEDEGPAGLEVVLLQQVNGDHQRHLTDVTVTILQTQAQCRDERLNQIWEPEEAVRRN